MIIESQHKLPKNFKKVYVQICLNIWGCVPIDYDWAIQTPIFKSKDVLGLSTYKPNPIKL